MTRPSVLVVDRDQLFLDLVTLQFSRDGLNAAGATSCWRARALIESARPALVILDASLPDSIHLLKYIRANDQPIDVIALVDSDDSRREVRNVGIEVVLDRNTHINNLRTAMRKLIDGAEFQSSAKDLQILIVDNEDAVRELIETALMQWGYSTLSARDDNEAFEAIDANPGIALALLDIGTTTNGMKVLTEIRARTPLTTTIILGTLADREIARQAIALGAFDYLVKPIELERLKGVISAGLSHRDYINRPLWRRLIS